MIKKVCSILLVIVWMLLIFVNSHDNGMESTNKSSTFITNVVSIFTKIPKDSEKMNDIVNKASFPIRKMAHFAEYFILAILVIYALTVWQVKNRFIICVSICILYASSDEIHQLFIPSRSGEIADILFDSFASIIGSFIFVNLNRLKLKNK